MALYWPSLRIWRRTGIATLVLLLAVMIGLRLFAMSPMARDMIEARLEATSVRGQTIEINGFKGDLLGNMSIASIQISDTDGIWLTASNLELGWKPLAYFNDHLHLTEVSAQSVTIDRRPTLTPSRGGGGGVERYTLPTLDMPNIALANGVAGPAQAYMASGAIQATRTQGAIQFDLTTTSQRGDDVRADLAWGGDVPLSGTLSVSGAPNGLIATFLQAPPDAEISLNLDSSASGNDWRLRADGVIAETQVLSVDLEISDQTYRTEGSIALDAIGALAPARARLGNQLEFAATLEADNVLDATATTDSFSLKVGGIARRTLIGLNIDDMTVIASDLDAERLSGVRSLVTETFAADGDLSFSPGEISFDGLVRSPELRYSEYAATELNIDGNWSYSPASITSEMRTEAKALSGLPGAIQTVFSGPVSARFSGEYDRSTEQVRARTLLLESGSLWVLGNGSAARSGAVSFDGEARVTGVDPISSLQTKWALTGGRLNAVQLKLYGAATLSDRLGTIKTTLGSPLEFDVFAQRTDDGLTIPSALLSSNQLKATAAGSLRQETLDFRGAVDLSTLTIPQVSAETVSTKFALTGNMDAPRFSANIQADGLSVAGQTLSAPELTTDILLTQQTTFEVTAQAGISGAPLRLNFSGRRADRQVAIERLDADWSNLVATGEATLDAQAPERSTIALDISGTTPLGGMVDASVDYASERLDADIAISDLEFGKLDLNQSRVQMTGAWPDFDGELTYHAELPILGTTQHIAGSHGLTGNAETRTVRLVGTTDLAGQTVSVTTPLTFSAAPNLGIKGAVSGFGGTAEVDLDLSGQNPSMLGFNGIQMATIAPLLNRPSLKGSMDGAFEIALIEDALTGRGTAQITKLARDAVDAALTDLALTMSVQDNAFTATLRTEGDANDLNFNVTASTVLQHDGSLLSTRLADGANIPVVVAGTGAIGPIWALAAPTNLRLVGDLNVDINNGAGDSWRFEGPLTLSDATFEDGLTGLHLKDISADAVLRPTGIEVQSARAAGRRSGFLEAEGLYHFDGAGSVEMTLNRLNAFSRSDVSVTVSGTTEIERQNRRTQITGDLEIDQARINLEQLPGAGYTTLDVVFEDDSDFDEDAAPEREAIELNLNVDADRRIFVSGSGVDTEWGLDARVTGPAGRPSVIGRATLVRGEADLLSRRFRFSDGTVQFIGDPLESTINIRAERTDDDVTASITLTGSINDPDIALGSDPSLPDDEILSRVLFGRSPTELSALEAAQLAGAAAQLAGGEAFNLVGQLQEATGLDRLSIALDDQGAATVSTGKYIAKDIYLEIETGGTGAPGVALEWTPLDNVAVDAEVDPELGPKVAVQWKRDFDRLPGEPDDN